MSKPAKQFYEFGEFRVDPTERRLLRDSVPLPLPPKAFDTLLVLVTHSGHLLSKDELMRLVWRDTFVEENNLTQYVSALRKILKHGDNGQIYIETVPRLGYRFAEGVREVWDEGESLIVERNTRLHIVVREEQTEESEPTTRAARNTAHAHVAASSHLHLRRTRLLTFAVSLVVSIAALALIASQATKFRDKESVRPDVKSIAVLSFKSNGARDDDKFLRTAMSEDLFGKLANLKQLDMRSANALLHDTQPARDASETGRALSVDAVLDGSVSRGAGERLKIAARLLRASDGAVLWSAEFDERVQNIFDVQERMSKEIAQTLALNLTDKEKESLTRRHTSNAEADEDYARGLYFWNLRSGEALHQSILSFEQAIAKDPHDALAYAALANAYAFDYALWTKSEATARQALEIDPTLGEAHAAIGFVRMFWQWRWDEAEQEFKRAVELSPHNATVHQWYAIYLAARTYGNAARAEMQEAHRLDPLSLSINADLGQILYFMHEYDQAIAQCRATLKLKPDFLNAHLYLYELYTQKRMHDEALEEFFMIQKLAGGNLPPAPLNEESLRKAYTDGGIKGFWQERIKLLNRLPDYYTSAQYYARLGDTDRALDALERAYGHHEFGLALVLTDPVFDELRTDARFGRFAQRLGVKIVNGDEQLATNKD